MVERSWRNLPEPKVPDVQMSQEQQFALAEKVANGASCRERGFPDWWTPSPAGGAGHGPVSRALLVCAGCPVADQCLELAAAADEREFVWGGVVLSHRMSAKAAWARVQAGHPVREQQLDEALREAATRNVEEDYGPALHEMSRDTKSQLRHGERARLRKAVAEGDVAEQIERDEASWRAVVRAALRQKPSGVPQASYNPTLGERSEVA